MTHHLSDNSWVYMSREERLTYAALGELKSQSLDTFVRHTPAQIASMNSFEKVMNNKYGEGTTDSKN